MIIIFHYISIFIYYLLRKKKRVKFLEALKEDERIKNGTLCGINYFAYHTPVYRQRYSYVYETILDERWRKQINSLVDFGSAKLVIFQYLKLHTKLNNIIFVDIDEDTLRDSAMSIAPRKWSYESLEWREQPLKVDVCVGSVADPDYRLLKTDAVTAVELIEHLYPDTLDAVPYNIFSFIEPKLVIITTPNADYNVLFLDNINGFRHYDHKFEWTRAQFEEWATNITLRFPDYTVSFSGLGEIPGHLPREDLGRCTQVALFIRKDLLDDKHISKVTPCLCSVDSPCKDSAAESKLLCSCVCALCSPSSSYGVCTHHSCSKQIVSFDRDDIDDLFTSNNIFYKCISRLEYPPDYIGRTEEEMMMLNYREHIKSIGRQWGQYYVKEKNRAEIPLENVVSGGSVPYLTEPELHKLLENYGYQIETCWRDVTKQFEVCVVHYPWLDRDSSASEASLYDSDAEFESYKRPLSFSDWDEPYVEEECSKPSELYQSTKDFDSLEMTSRESQLEPPTDVEEDKKQQDSLFDSGYQKSLSLLDDSPQTPLDDLEETDVFEDTASTPSLSSEVHLRRATALEKEFAPAKVDANRVNELDSYRNMPTGRGPHSHPLPPPPPSPEAYRKSFLKDKDPLPGPSSSSTRKRKKFKKGAPSDAEEESPTADVKTIAACILENTLNGLGGQEKDELIEFVVPGVEVVEVIPLPAVEAAQGPAPVVENGDLANNNRDVEDPEERDQFEDTTRTPSLTSQDNRVHLRKATALESTGSVSSSRHVKKLKAVDSNRINELDRYCNIPPGRVFLSRLPPPPRVVKKKFARDPLPGPSGSRKRKKPKKDVPVDDEDDALEDVKAVATCILKNTLNKIDVQDHSELIEFAAPEVGEVAPSSRESDDASQESIVVVEDRIIADTSSNADRKGNNYIAQDEAEDYIGNDIANDNLELDAEEALHEDNAAAADNNNEFADARGAIEDPPDVVEEPAEAEDGRQAESAVAKASREALFDENSEQDLLEDFEIPAPIHEAPAASDRLDENNIRLIGVRLGSTPENLETDLLASDGFPNWLLQILGAQAVLEEVTPPGSEEGSHFYCQGDGLGVHPSVIAVEVEEEDESTESSNNTADYGEADQESSQDMASLPEDTQTNGEENLEVPEVNEEGAGPAQPESANSDRN